jgi:hypothetical protein
VLAGHIADRVSSEHPHAQLTTVTGTLTVERLAGILVADSASLVVLDQFDANVTDGTMANRGLAAVLVCLAEEIACRDDEGRRTRIIITARQPLMLSPRILVRRVGPLTRQSADEFASSLPRLGKLTGAEREYAWRLTAGNPRSLCAFDARLADATFAELAESLARAIAARAGLSATLVFPAGLDTPAASAIAAAVESVLTPPRTATRADAPDKPASRELAGRAHARSRLRGTRLRVLSAALVVGVIAWAPFAAKQIVAHFSPAAVAVRTSRPAIHVNPTTQADQADQAAEAATVSWLAGNVTPGTVIGCDPVVCASLSRQGLAQADLAQLRPGSDLSADGLIVATPRARALMGTAITAAAPELAASFGVGSGRIQVWEVTPGGAAAYYSWRLAADMASRREGGNLIMGNASIKASGNGWMLLCGGHVDSRILVALAEIAHSAPLTIASFGAANPGAASEVPLRSVLIDVANPAAAAAYLNVQDPVMRPLTVRLGHASLWVEFGAPIPLGLFQARS